MESETKMAVLGTRHFCLFPTAATSLVPFSVLVGLSVAVGEERVGLTLPGTPVFTSGQEFMARTQSRN